MRLWKSFNNILALLCLWWNLESLAQRGMADVKYWNPVFPFSDFLLKDFFSSNLTGVWKIRHLLRSVRCDGAKPAMGLVASLAPVQSQQSLREHNNKSFCGRRIPSWLSTVNVFVNQTDIFLVRFSQTTVFGNQEGFQPLNIGLSSICSNSNIACTLFKSSFFTFGKYQTNLLS